MLRPWQQEWYDHTSSSVRSPELQYSDQSKVYPHSPHQVCSRGRQTLQTSIFQIQRPSLQARLLRRQIALLNRVSRLRIPGALPEIQMLLCRKEEPFWQVSLQVRHRIYREQHSQSDSE